MIVNLNHVNIFSANVDATVAFYSDVLGLAPGWTPDFPVRVQWLYSGGHALVHVVEVPSARPAEGVAIDHYAFSIDDFDAALRKLEKADCPYKILEIADGRIRQAFITDPNGVRIELNWRAPEFDSQVAE